MIVVYSLVLSNTGSQVKYCEVGLKTINDMKLSEGFRVHYALHVSWAESSYIHYYYCCVYSPVFYFVQQRYNFDFLISDDCKWPNV